MDEAPDAPSNRPRNGDTSKHSPADNGSSVPTSQKEPPRSSGVSPLAPLEYLQKQRRGSITDPSLHAAHHSHPSSSTYNTNAPSAFRHPEPPVSSSGTPPTHQDSNHSPQDPRPSSPYTFGDATAQSSHNRPKHNLRTTTTGHGSSVNQGTRASPEQMNVDSNDKLDKQLSLSPINSARTTSREQFDYSMRRHSIAAGADPHTPLPHPAHGTKRKMSNDRNAFATVDEEIDPQLVGPGIPSGMNVDSDGPAPKRRGSAIDTQRIAQLSLYDRRGSVDSRAGSWWLNNGRRDSTSSLSNGSGVGGYGTPAFAGESPQGRPPPGISTFTWPAAAQTPEAAMQPSENATNTPRSFEPHLSIIHSTSFAPDRRMSMPDAIPPNAAGPTRALRSRSRPPSRQMRNADLPNATHPGSSSGAPGSEEDPVSAPSPASSTQKGSTKESASTPYSRSPELRVSHKLAERKRRKEMKDLFDELRDQLPADRGMKASKWEILSKAIDFVVQLKTNHQEMAREIDMLRHELDSMRQGIPPFGPGGPPPPHAVVYSQGPIVPGQYPPPPPGVMQHPPPPPPNHVPPANISRPNSSQNMFPPGGGPSAPPAQQQNGSTSMAVSEGPPS